MKVLQLWMVHPFHWADVGRQWSIELIRNVGTEGVWCSDLRSVKEKIRGWKWHHEKERCCHERCCNPDHNYEVAWVINQSLYTM